MTALVSSRARRPIAEGYDLRIGTFYYRLAATPRYSLVFGSKDSLAERGDDRGSPQENVLDIGYAWARTDLSGGEGFDWDPPDIPVESAIRAQDPRRYFSSNGVNVSRPEAGNQYELTLSKAWATWLDLGTALSVSASKTFLFAAFGDTVTWYADTADTTPEGSDQIVAATNVIKLVATPDDRVVALLANGDLYKRDAGGATFSLLFNSTTGGVDMVNVWFVKGRFMGFLADGKVLEVHYDGTAPTEVQDLSSDLDMLDMVESGPAIVAAMSDGTLRTFATELVSGVPELVPASVNEVPRGETPYLLGSNAGRLLFMTLEGTTARLYEAEVLSSQYDFVIGNQQLRRTWNVTAENVNVITKSMAATRDEILLSIDEQGGPGTWRYDLVTSGLSRMSTPFGASTTTHSLGIFRNQPYAVASVDGGVWLESVSTFVSSGWLISPNITFGLNTVNNWIASVIEAANLDTPGHQVELWYSTFPEAIKDWQSPLWRLHQRITSPSQAGIESPWNSVESRSLALQLRITGSGTDSPSVTRVALRGFPSHRDRVLVLPVDVSDMVSAPGRHPTHIPNYGYSIQTRLKALLGTNVELEFLRFDEVYKGIVDRVSEPIELISDRGSPTVQMLLEFRGTLDDLKFITGTGGVGLGTVGVAQVGTGVMTT